ncbi:MAG: hypothetical protein HY782_20095 [Chloroflexi bacterium]|nr:hypothetical protein [Chloroflexota bacterium]
MATTWLELAIQAARQGEVARARELLRGYVRYYPREEVGWLWLSRATDSPSEKLKLVQRGLAACPQNALLRAEYAKLAASQSHSTSTLSKPRYTRSVVVARASWLCRAFEWNLLALSLALALTVVAATTPAFLGNRIVTWEGALVVAHVTAAADLQVGDEIILDVPSELETPHVRQIAGIEYSQGLEYVRLTNDERIVAPRQVWRVKFSFPFLGHATRYAATPVMAGLFLLIALTALVTLKLLGRKHKQNEPAKFLPTRA